MRSRWSPVELIYLQGIFQMEEAAIDPLLPQLILGKMCFAPQKYGEQNDRHKCEKDLAKI